MASVDLWFVMYKNDIFNCVFELNFLRHALHKHLLRVCSGTLFRAFIKLSGSGVGRLKCQETQVIAWPLVVHHETFALNQATSDSNRAYHQTETLVSLFLMPIVGKQHVLCTPNSRSDCLDLPTSQSSRSRHGRFLKSPGKHSKT